MMKTAAQPIWRPRQCGFDIALADLEFARDVALELLVHQVSAGFDGLVDIDHGRQRIEFKPDPFRRVFRLVSAGRDDDGDRLADETHLVGRKHGLHGNVEAVTDLISLESRADPRPDEWQDAATSAPLRACTTPGAALACVRSTPRMRAWATELRTKAACSMRGNSMSAMKRPWPVNSRRSSRRGIERPTKEVSCGCVMAFSHRTYIVARMEPRAHGARGGSRGRRLPLPRIAPSRCCATAPSGLHAMISAHLFGGGEHGLDDVLVTGTAADDGRDRLRAPRRHSVTDSSRGSRAPP